MADAPDRPTVCGVKLPTRNDRPPPASADRPGPTDRLLGPRVHSNSPTDRLLPDPPPECAETGLHFAPPYSKASISCATQLSSTLPSCKQSRKKNFCDDRIAVRQLVSHVYLAGTARACQRKPPEKESSVGWLSRTSRRDLVIAICDFLFLLLFHLQLSRISLFFCRA